jgi:hypothetical protein
MPDTKITDLTLATAAKLDEFVINDVTDNSDKKVTTQGILDAMTGDATSASGVISLAANSVDSAEITAGAVDIAHLSASGTPDATTFLRGDNTWATPAGSGDMVLASAQTNTGIKTFLDTTMKLRNVANTFDGYFVNTNTDNRIYTLPDVAGTVSLIGATETLVGKTLTTPTISGTGFTNAQHAHLGATSGGQITEASISDLQAYILDISGSPLSELSDTTITAIGANEILKWDGAAWINNTLAEAGIQASGTYFDTAGNGLTSSGSTVNAVGTASRISVSADAIDIDSAYVGQATITTLGTITTGVWTGTAIASANLDADTMHLSVAQAVTGAKTFDSGAVIYSGATSGTITLNATAVAGANTLTLPAATDTLVGKATTDTFTNKTFDANGTGNSLSNVDVADLAVGTDGELITWDASGNPATVATGSSGEVLTSNGVGTAPTFQAAGAADNLGNHTATTTLLMVDQDINAASAGTTDPFMIQNEIADVDDSGATAIITLNSKTVTGAVAARDLFDIQENGTPVFAINNAGVIDVGTWQGTAIASAFLDADTAHLTTTQTFTGNKTFDLVTSITSNTASPATAGVLRLANTDSIGFRNAENDFDYLLGMTTNNMLQLTLEDDHIDGFQIANSDGKCRLIDGNAAAGTWDAGFQSFSLGTVLPSFAMFLDGAFATALDTSAANYAVAVRGYKDPEGSPVNLTTNGIFTVANVTEKFFSVAANGDVSIADGNKLFLDAAATGVGSDTYLEETSADLVTHQVGGEAGLRLQETGTEINAVFGANNQLAVGATDGFVHIPNMAGTPTSAPPTTYTGKTPLVYDDTNNILYAYDGAAWSNVGSGGGEFTSAWTANHNEGGSTFALEDAKFADPTDDTKTVQMDLSGNGTGIELTIATLQSTAQGGFHTDPDQQKCRPWEQHCNRYSSRV